MPNNIKLVLQYNEMVNAICPEHVLNVVPTYAPMRPILSIVWNGNAGIRAVSMLSRVLCAPTGFTETCDKMDLSVMPERVGRMLSVLMESSMKQLVRETGGIIDG